MRHTLFFVFTLVLGLAIVACGGSSGNGTMTNNSPESSTGTGTIFGAIRGFGSVFVNGVKYNTDSAVVTRDDDRLNDVRELEIGMLVRVEGDLDSSMASLVSYDETVKGPIDMVNPLTVLGQTVVTNAATAFHGTNLSQLLVGDILEISGLRDANDDIVAHFIEKKDPTTIDDYEVTGNVRNLDTAAMSFRIDGLTVDYSAADVNDLPGGTPTEGQLVEVKDQNRAYTVGALTLTATKVEAQHVFGSGSMSGRRVEIESIVTQVISNTEFMIGGIKVVTTTNTRFLFGNAVNIVAGMRLEVEGNMIDNGMLQATKVKFEDNDARIKARVDAIDEVTRTVTLLGIPVTVSDSTSFEDDINDNNTFSLQNIRVGDYVETHGFIGSSGAFVASELRRENDDAKVEIRAPVEAKDETAGTITLLGLTVSSGVDTEFRGLRDEAVSRAQFFSAITSGLTLVEAKWDPFSNLSAPVKEFELED